MATAGFIDKGTGLKWHVLKRTNRAYGYEYVVAERNRWVPELRQPRVDARQQIGRLMPTGQIKISKKFTEKFPQFESCDELYYWDHQLVSRGQYLELNPDAATEWSDIENVHCRRRCSPS